MWRGPCLRPPSEESRRLVLVASRGADWEQFWIAGRPIGLITTTLRELDGYRLRSGLR